MTTPDKEIQDRARAAKINRQLERGLEALEKEGHTVPDPVLPPDGKTSSRYSDAVSRAISEELDEGLKARDNPPPPPRRSR